MVCLYCTASESENGNEAENCPVCKEPVKYAYIGETLKRATRDLAAMDKQSDSHCLKYLDHYWKWLSNNHYLLTEVRISLAQIIGQAFDIQTISDDRLALKMKLAKDLISLINKLSPSEARLLGLLHFELHAALAETGRRGAKKKNPTFVAAYEESLLNAEKTLAYLQHEPTVLPEGRVYKQAKINSDSLKIMLLQKL